MIVNSIGSRRFQFEQSVTDVRLSSLCATIWGWIVMYLEVSVVDWVGRVGARRWNPKRTVLASGRSTSRDPRKRIIGSRFASAVIILFVVMRIAPVYFRNPVINKVLIIEEYIPRKAAGGGRRRTAARLNIINFVFRLLPYGVLVSIAIILFFTF